MVLELPETAQTEEAGDRDYVDVLPYYIYNSWPMSSSTLSNICVTVEKHR